MSRLGQILMICGFLFLILWFVAFRALDGNNLPIVWVLLGVSGACILGALFKDAKFYVELFSQRSTKHGLNMGTMVILVLGILIALNFIGYRNVKKFDFTKEGLNSISDQTKNILKSLDSDLQVRAFFAMNNPQSGADQAKFKELMELARTVSDKVKVTYIDPIKKPEAAKEYEITMSGTISLEYKGKKSKIEDTSEQGFTNAVIKLTRDKNKIAYLTTGHGEIDFESGEPNGGQSFKKALTDSSYEVKNLSFIDSPKIPEDADLVIIAGPKQSFLDPEIKAIEAYIYKGGHVLIAFDPGTRTNIGKIANFVGVEHKNNYVLDQLGQLVGGGGATAVGINYSPYHEITKEFKSAMTIFHLASQLKVSANKPEGVTVDEIVKSSPASFSKPDIRGGAVKFDEKKDEKGPLTLVAAVSGKFKDGMEGTPGDFTVVVAGDSDFLTNQLFDAQLNRDLALNSIAFLAKDKELVSIRPKQAESSQIVITKTQSTLLYYGLVFILPLAIFVMGGAVWYRRRTA